MRTFFRLLAPLPPCIICERVLVCCWCLLMCFFSQSSCSHCLLCCRFVFPVSHWLSQVSKNKNKRSSEPQTAAFDECDPSSPSIHPSFCLSVCLSVTNIWHEMCVSSYRPNCDYLYSVKWWPLQPSAKIWIIKLRIHSLVEYLSDKKCLTTSCQIYFEGNLLPELCLLHFIQVNKTDFVSHDNEWKQMN